jgi:NhaP-type Na+/H+ or K+/H+ antiporter
MSHDTFISTLALIGLVILVSSLLSGAVERTGLPQVAIFLLLGVVLGPSGLGVIDLPLHSPTLQVIATLALVLVLFSDAIGVDLGEVREHRRLTALILGPGTLLPAALIALAAWLLLGLSAPAAAILGASLASTDPVLLRTLTRHPAVPPPARLALKLESGINDVILLPIVVLAMLVLQEGAAGEREAGRKLVGLFVLGPLLGAIVGYAAITLLDLIRKKFGVRRDYESLYALGVALTAFAAAEAVGGSGFLAAFAAGLVIAALDVELCDCFLDYGEASAEMFLLLTFVAFGAGLIWTGFTVADARTLLFAGIALLMRTVVLIPVLKHSGIATRNCRIIAWFGPRGLSSLLLVLVPVFADVPGAEQLFSITCLVVLLSVVLHGGGIAYYLRRLARATDQARGAPSAAPSSTPSSTPAPRPSDPEADLPERITLDEVKRLRDEGAPFLVLDVRTERSYREDTRRAAGALRLPPDDAVRLARERRLDPHSTLVLYCT